MTFPVHKITQTGAELDNILDLSDEFIKGFASGGIVIPTDVPLFHSSVPATYTAVIPGIYTNFGGVTVTGNSVISYDGTTYIVTPIGGSTAPLHGH